MAWVPQFGLRVEVCNRRFISKLASGCVHMACDSLLTTSLLQDVNRLAVS